MQATDRELEDDELAADDAYGMAATVEFELEAKQELLELRSENARLRLLARLLAGARSSASSWSSARRSRARSNGKVRFG